MPVAGFLSNWATPQVDRGRDIDVPHVSVRSPFSQVAAVSPDPRASYVPDCDAHPHAAAASRLDQEQRLPPLQAVAGWYPGLRAAPCEAIGGDLEISRSVHLTRSEPPRFVGGVGVEITRQALRRHEQPRNARPILHQGSIWAPARLSALSAVYALPSIRRDQARPVGLIP
jgi:hypothetical protein